MTDYMRQAASVGLWATVDERPNGSQTITVYDDGQPLSAFHNDEPSFLSWIDKVRGMSEAERREEFAQRTDDYLLTQQVGMGEWLIGHLRQQMAGVAV